MPPPVKQPGQPIAEFYAAFWTWWHARYRPTGPPLRPFAGGPPGVWAGVDTADGPRVRAGIAFSGNEGAHRVVKAELYVDDATNNDRWTKVVLPGIASGSAPFDQLWTRVGSQQLHWHPEAGEGRDPGVIAYRDTHGQHPNDAAHRSEPFGKSPTLSVPAAVSIGQFGQAGRVATFHERAFDLANATDVAAAGDWMARAFAVFESVLKTL